MKATLFSLAAIAALASAAPLKRDAGPSGTLVTPYGGQSFAQFDRYPGFIPVTYNVVQGNSEATTMGIDVSLEKMDGSASYILAEGFNNSNQVGSAAPNGQINGYFLTPQGWCGDFRLVVNERQIYEGGYITFRAAAPTVTITCSA